MTFLQLYDKIGKQPIKNVRQAELEVVLTREVLEEMLKEKKSSYVIPLDLKFGNGKQKLWFVKKQSK